MLCSLASLVAVGCGMIGYKRWNKASATKTNSPNSSAQQGTLEITSNEQERMQDTTMPVSTCGFQDSQLVSRMEPSVTGPGNIIEVYDEVESNLSHNSSPPTSSVPPTHTTADPFAKL